MMFFREGFESDPKIMKSFIKAYNRASAYASDLVLEKCNELLSGFTRETDPKSGVLPAEGANRLLDIISEIYTAIRKDINPKASNFKVGTFWAEQKEDKS